MHSNIGLIQEHMTILYTARIELKRFKFKHNFQIIVSIYHLVSELNFFLKNNLKFIEKKENLFNVSPQTSIL